MARYIYEKDILQKNVDQRLEASTTEHSKYLSGTPIFVTYYNKNVEASTQDVTLENVKELIGYESPIRYNKIEDVPLYNIDSINPTIQNDELFGLDTEGTGEATILPDTFKPLTDDFFIIKHTGNERLFKVTDVQIDKLNGKKYYKISFQLAREEKDLLDEQIDTNFVSYYENIGTEKKSIVEKTDSVFIDELVALKDKLIDRYNQCFLNKRYSIYLYKYNDTYLYNEYCIKFIKDNKVFERKKKLYSSIYIQDLLEDQISLYDSYIYTVYNALSEKNIDNLSVENFKPFSLYQDINTPFFSDPEKYAQCFYIPDDDKNLKIEDPNPERFLNSTIYPFKNKLNSAIKNNENFEDNDEFFLENKIIDYLNNKIIIDYDFIIKVNKTIFKPELKVFLLLPCLIFIINEEIKSLFNRKEFN